MIRCSLVALVVVHSGCQFILGIEDKQAQPMGGQDAGIDAPLDLACDPVGQTGCDADEKCASVRVSGSNPPVSVTECADNGTVGPFQQCREMNGVDDCESGLTCFKGLCTAICPVESGSCAARDTCIDSADLFSDQQGSVGACAPQCDPMFQDCEFQTEGCYVNVRLGEAQCRPEPPKPAPVQEQACISDSMGCLVNSCAIGHGPHVANTADLPPDHCSFYCTAVDTSIFNSDFQFGDAELGVDCFATFSGPRPDGPGKRQCRFLHTFGGVANANPSIGICVDMTVYGNCQECDISTQGTAMECAPGCISQATFDDLPPG